MIKAAAALGNPILQNVVGQGSGTISPFRSGCELGGPLAELLYTRTLKAKL